MPLGVEREKFAIVGLIFKKQQPKNGEICVYKKSKCEAMWKEKVDTPEEKTKGMENFENFFNEEEFVEEKWNAL